MYVCVCVRRCQQSHSKNGTHEVEFQEMRWPHHGHAKTRTTTWPTTTTVVVVVVWRNHSVHDDGPFQSQGNKKKDTRNPYSYLKPLRKTVVNIFFTFRIGLQTFIVYFRNYVYLNIVIRKDSDTIYGDNYHYYSICIKRDIVYDHIKEY